MPILKIWRCIINAIVHHMIHRAHWQIPLTFYRQSEMYPLFTTHLLLLIFVKGVAFAEIMTLDTYKHRGKLERCPIIRNEQQVDCSTSTQTKRQICIWCEHHIILKKINKI